MIKKWIAAILSVWLLLSCSGIITAYAAEEAVINISAEDMEQYDSEAVKDALNKAKKNATKANPYTIVLPSGTYDMRAGLNIYSNTTLILQSDTVLRRTFESGNLIKAGLANETNTGYDGYENITIQGGVWDSDYLGSSCTMRFAHCKNITISDVTVKNVTDAHHIELAAAKDFTIQNCTFSGFKRTKNVSGEAVQIDILHNQTHFPDYKEFDDTPCKNITVTNCTFNDVFSGVGTRSGVIGSYFSNINISNNVFNNVADRAICTFNYIKSTIKNNVINNASVGVFMEWYPSNNLTTKLYMPNDSSKSTKIKTDCSTEVSGNYIVVKKDQNYVTSGGISVFGGTLSETNAKNYGLKAGNYYVKNLAVKGNTIITQTAASRGMYLYYVQNSEIQGNNIYEQTVASSGYHGIMLSHSSKNKIIGNLVQGAFERGISVASSSKNNTLSANTILNVKNYGVFADSTSTIFLENSNGYAGCGVAAININSVYYAPAAAVMGAKGYIKGRRARLVWKKAANVSGYRIYRSTSKEGTYKLVGTVKGAGKNIFYDKVPKKNKTYYYKIAAYTAANNSEVVGFSTAATTVAPKK